MCMLMQCLQTKNDSYIVTKLPSTPDILENAYGSGLWSLHLHEALTHVSQNRGVAMPFRVSGMASL